jgi:hypothetical protein
MPPHTPTPWTMDSLNALLESGDTDAIDSFHCEAIRCVNEREALLSVCRNMIAAWNNRDETTSLHVWNERMKSAIADLQAVLAQSEQEAQP